METFHTNQNQSQKDIEAGIASYLKESGELERYRHAIPALSAYFQELYLWNRRLNLTGLRSPGDMIKKHLGDTLVLSRWLPEEVVSVIDIGTGAGIPGLILKILDPDLKVCLLDARRKRISFLQAVIAGLGLEDVWAIQGRAGEGAAPMCPGGITTFDLVVSQAVGSIADLLSMAQEFSGADTIVVAMKGPGGKREMEEAGAALSEAGWSAQAIKDFTPVQRQRRYLVVMRRNSP